MSLVDARGRPLGRPISGKLAIRVMAEEIGAVIGERRLRAFERAVRARVERDYRGTTNAQGWIVAMAEIITENGDAQADRGFQRGIRRIRKLGGDV